MKLTWNDTTAQAQTKFAEIREEWTCLHGAKRVGQILRVEGSPLHSMSAWSNRGDRRGCHQAWRTGVADCNEAKLRVETAARRAHIESTDPRLGGSFDAFHAVLPATAWISECGRYRYSLTRRWDRGDSVLFIMLNPSTADALIDDPTIRRCIDFAKGFGYNAIEVVNLYAWRATKPEDLPPTTWIAVGPDNDVAIAEAVDRADIVIAAWGASAGQYRSRDVLAYLDAIGKWPYCLGATINGSPKHPLYLPKDTELIPVPRGPLAGL